MEKISTNRRSHNRLHKKYRLLKADLWSRLAQKNRDNYITKLISDFARENLDRK